MKHTLRLGLFVLAVCVLSFCGCSTGGGRTTQVGRTAADAQAIDSTINDRNNWIDNPAHPARRSERNAP